MTGRVPLSAVIRCAKQEPRHEAIAFARSLIGCLRALAPVNQPGVGGFAGPLPADVQLKRENGTPKSGRVAQRRGDREPETGRCVEGWGLLPK